MVVSIARAERTSEIRVCTGTAIGFMIRAPQIRRLKKLFLLSPGQTPGGVPRNKVRAAATPHHLTAEAFHPERERLESLECRV